MPKQKYHNPQDDVVKIMNGRREPVKSYDMYQAMHAGPGRTQSADKDAVRSNAPSAASSAQAQPDVFLHFDGQNLRIVQDQDGVCKEVISVPAVSGRRNEDGSFSYDKERQKIPNVGPQPEGIFSVRPGDILYRKDDTLRSKIGSFVGGGNFPWGGISWGVGKVNINMTPEQIQETGRKDTTIHGGLEPGSRGCIDTVCNDEKFFSALEKIGKKHESIPLVVDYSNTPDKVFFPKNECRKK